MKQLAFALVLSFSAVLSLHGSASAQVPTLESLLEEFSQLPGLEARFVEEKQIALLVVPTRSEGRIWFSNDRLMRRVTIPEPSAALIADGQLTMRSGSRIERLSIRENPVLHGFVESFRAVLAGNREVLERFYDAELTVDDDGWVLHLRPRNADLRRFLRVITMRGSGVTIREMRMVEVNGDETRTRFTEVNTQRRFSASEARRIFTVR